MVDERLLGPPRIRRKLAELANRELNFDLAALRQAGPVDGWHVTDLRQPLPPERPGRPSPDGSWQIARRLMRGYDFADPSIVRAYYDPSVPLERRNMLLRLQALGVLYLLVGVRVGEVYERSYEVDGRSALVWGWNYRTLEGHVEMGQMDWQAWKWLETGDVEFRVYAVSRTAPTANALVRVGFHLMRDRERRAFLQSTQRRMRAFTELALERERGGEDIRQAAAKLTARPSSDEDPAHHQLARNLDSARG